MLTYRQLKHNKVCVLGNTLQGGSEQGSGSGERVRCCKHRACPVRAGLPQATMPFQPFALCNSHLELAELHEPPHVVRVETSL